MRLVPREGTLRWVRRSQSQDLLVKIRSALPHLSWAGLSCGVGNTQVGQPTGGGGGTAGLASDLVCARHTRFFGRVCDTKKGGKLLSGGRVPWTPLGP